MYVVYIWPFCILNRRYLNVCVLIMDRNILQENIK